MASVALVTGAGSGIGLALAKELRARDSAQIVYATARRPETCRELLALAAADAQIRPLALDLLDGRSRAMTVDHLVAAGGRLDLVINTAGILHEHGGMAPEKRLADVRPKWLSRAFDVNASGMLLLAQALEPLLRQSSRALFASLSARVGSIADNRKGGWYAYRASKAAHNMFIRTLAIEWGRLRPPITCVALHPGTVASQLSAPFVQDGSRDDVFSPATAARHLIDVTSGLSQEQSGGFYAWDGTTISW